MPWAHATMCSSAASAVSELACFKSFCLNSGVVAQQRRKQMSNRTIDEAFKIHNLIAWLEQRSGSYDYSNGRHCMLAKYLREKTNSRVDVTATSVHVEENNTITTYRLPDHFDWIAHGCSYREHAENWTFEDALQRARLA